MKSTGIVNAVTMKIMIFMGLANAAVMDTIMDPANAAAMDVMIITMNMAGAAAMITTAMTIMDIIMRMRFSQAGERRRLISIRRKSWIIL